MVRKAALHTPPVVEAQGMDALGLLIPYLSMPPRLWIRQNPRYTSRSACASASGGHPVHVLTDTFPMYPTSSMPSGDEK